MSEFTCYKCGVMIDPGHLTELWTLTDHEGVYYVCIECACEKPLRSEKLWG